MCTFGCADMQRISLHFGSLPPGGELLSGPVGIEMPRAPLLAQVVKSLCQQMNARSLHEKSERNHHRSRAPFYLEVIEVFRLAYPL